METNFLFACFVTVAAAGLPEARKDHAVVMARFARDCNSMMAPLVKRLEVDLGPDTGDLKLRTGLHSGPVTGKNRLVCQVLPFVFVTLPFVFVHPIHFAFSFLFLLCTPQLAFCAANEPAFSCLGTQ